MSENQLIIEINNVISLHKIEIQAQRTLLNSPIGWWHQYHNQHFIRCSKYPPFTSIQALIRTADRVARQAYAQSTICYSMRALGHPPFKQLLDKFVQSKRISSFAREFSHNSPQSIIGYKNLNKCFIFFAKNHFRGFL